LRAHVVDRETHRERVELAEQRVAISVVCIGQRRPWRHDDSQRGQGAMTRGPQLLTLFD
jgi:hypothetical protein